MGVATGEYSSICSQAKPDYIWESATTGIASMGIARLSHFLNFKGPIDIVETACSSALVAVHKGVAAIQTGDCNLAIVGGGQLILTPKNHISFRKSGAICKDGRCKTFSNEANGYGRGEGIGAVVLKSLDLAKKGGDPIYAIIKGSAVNHDGRSNSLTAPNPVSQAEVIATAQKRGGVDPSTVTYIEAHGTGTPLGDPIEIQGLKKAFTRKNKTELQTAYCGLGTVKSHIGHLEIAAGISGFIKTVLQIRQKQLIKTLHLNELNPKIEIENSPFYILSENRKWDNRITSNGEVVPLRAGVSSFGFSGVNAHVVLEEYQISDSPQPQAIENGKELGVFVLSAKTKECLNLYVADILDYLEVNREVNFADMLFTFQVGREAMNERLAVVCSDQKSLMSSLTSFLEGKTDERSFCGGEKKKNSVLHKSSAFQLFIKELFEKKDHKSLAEMWASGLDFDWKGSGEWGNANRLSGLPTYPFARERYWMEKSLAREHSPLETQASPVTATGDSNCPSDISLAVKKLMSSILNIDLERINMGLSFIDMGADSILFMEIARQIEKEFGLEVTADQFIEELDTIEALAVYISENAENNASIENKISSQKAYLNRFIEEYEKRTPQSKKEAIKYRKSFADQRTPTYFLPSLKEIHYPLTCQYAKAGHLVDLDGNRYIDISGDMGANLFGHQPDFLTEALKKYLEQGTSLSGTSPLLGKTMKLLCELTLMERATICQTGSEAVMTAMKIARAATRRNKIVLFADSYHGHFDGVIITGVPGEGNILEPLIPRASASGIPQSFLKEVIVLEYGGQNSLEIISHKSEEIAAVLVEPVQSRHLENQPKEFLKSLRKITEEKKIVLIFDEMITGFRVHPQGAQGWFGVKADLATYGKILGGGFPVGALAGNHELMRCLEGAEKTLAEGSNAQNPINVNAIYAVLSHLKKEGMRLQEKLNQKTDEMVRAINQFLEEKSVPMNLNSFGSFFRFSFFGNQDTTAMRLFANVLNHKGIRIYPAGNCFLTTCHTQADIDWIIKKVKEALNELMSTGFLQISRERGKEKDPIQDGVFSSQKSEGRRGQKKLKKIAEKRKREIAEDQTPLIFQKDKKNPGDDRHNQYLSEIIDLYQEKTQKSRAEYSEYNEFFANPNPDFGSPVPELEYPVSVESFQSRMIQDLDGNSYIDISGGTGVNFFGAQPDFILEAIKKQISDGIYLSCRSPLIGKTIELLCEITGMERAMLCQSGTEAVWSALRVARAATGKSKIAIFKDSYHGLYDGVLISGEKKSAELQYSLKPVCPGVSAANTEDVILLDYGKEHSLSVIEENSKEIAAVLVEPVQGQNLHLQPKNFLKKLRKLTRGKGLVLIFDEILTGFRIHPKGAQGYFDIDADMVIYGNLLGGGITTGCIAGKIQWMDWVDGGFWNYGDASRPSLNKTFVAGTHTQNPVKVAGMHAVLNYFKKEGRQLQDKLNRKTDNLCGKLNEIFSRNGIPAQCVHCGSIFQFRFLNQKTDVFECGSSFESRLFQKLLFIKGIFIEGTLCFLSTVHTEDDLSKIIQGVQEAAEELVAKGFLKSLSENEIKDPLVFPLSYGQVGLWYNYLKNPDEYTYNIPYLLHLHGHVDIFHLKTALRKVSQKHPTLRIRLAREEEKPVQILSPDFKLDFQVINILQDNKQPIREILEKEYKRPFNLEEGQVCRFRLFSKSDEDHYFFGVIHHIANDGYGMTLLHKEILACYKGKNEVIFEDHQTFAPFLEFIEREKRIIKGKRGKKLRSYWQKELEGEIPMLNLPLDFPRSSGTTIQSYGYDFNKEQTKNSQDFAKKNKVTLFTLFFSAFAIMLSRYTGQTDFFIGLPTIPNDRLSKFRETIGYFINTLPVRVNLSENPSVKEVLKRLNLKILRTTSQQDYPFQQIVRDIGLSSTTEALLRVGINLDLSPDLLEEKQVLTEGLSFEPLSMFEQASEADLTLMITDKTKKIHFGFCYNSRLFEESTIKRFAQSFRLIVEGILSSPNQLISRLPAMSEAEKQQILYQWNDTQVKSPHEGKCIHQIFEEQAMKTPQSTAVSYGDKSLTYGELDRQSKVLAESLQNQGLQPNLLVGIFMERSLDMLVGLLGILKAGGAYVPLDPQYPQERLEFILRDSQAKIVLTQSQFKEKVGTLFKRQNSLGNPFHPSIVVMEELRNDNEHGTEIQASGKKTTCCREQAVKVHCPEKEVQNGDLAYVIYTSGSTGDPKGVMIPHLALTNFLSSMAHRPGLQKGDKLLAVTTYCFDIAGLELFLPLIQGGQCHICEAETTKDAEKLKNLIRKTKPNLMQATPST